MDKVECYSGSNYGERPLAFHWQGYRVEVSEIMARWRGTDHIGFRIKTTTQQDFELTYWEISEEWHVQPL